MQTSSTMMDNTFYIAILYTCLQVLLLWVLLWWLITKNGILLTSSLVSTIIICHIVVTVHDAIHYPSQHPYMQNQKWFKFLDNHHLIHHIDTEKNVNFLLPICDFLFGTMRLYGPWRVAESQKVHSLISQGISLVGLRDI